MMSQIFARSGVRAAAAARTCQRRTMAGFPKDMSVRKNKFVEEWNGRREITEKAFEVKSGNLFTLLMTCVAAPYFVYYITREELLANGGRRYTKNGVA